MNIMKTLWYRDVYYYMMRISRVYVASMPATPLILMIIDIDDEYRMSDDGWW